MALATLIGLALALLTAIPLAWKWQLGIARSGVVIVLLAIVSGAAAAAAAPGLVVAAALVWTLSLAGAFSLLAYRFYRDPERSAPARRDVVVSPADGVVVYVRRSEAGMLPVADKHGRRYALTELTRTPLESGDATVIGIAMNFADVHVNRAPVEGRVAFRRHFPGLFGSLRRPEMVFENERATTVIDGGGLQVAVVQIASRLVRQIASYVREGQAVALGERLGVIRLGSQVDLVLPARGDLTITTRVGERLRAGESIVAVRDAARHDARAACEARRPEGALVIAEHVRGLALVRSLGRRGIPVWTLEPAGEAMASRSRYSRRSFAWPRASEAEQVEMLLALAARHQLRGWALFTSGDETTALCARHHARLADRFRMTGPPWDAIAWACDKRQTSRLAAEAGVDQPRTFRADGPDALSRLTCEFPVVLKPAFKREPNPFTRDKAWRADDPATLAARFEEACRFVPADVVMIQELIPGDGRAQFSFAAACAGGEPVAWLTARRTRQYPIDFGHSSSFVETVEQPAVEEAARRLLAAARYTGLVEIEFKYDARDGRFKLLDVNPRVWTWHALGRRAGVDFPYLHWQMLRGEPVSPVRARPGVRWVRMATDLPAAYDTWRRGALTLSEYARSLRGPVELATFAADDPLPALVGPLRFAAPLTRRAV